MTPDFLEDACDSLDKSADPYLIITGIPGSSRLRVSSNLGDSAMLLRKLIQSGDLADNISDHLDHFYNIRP